MSEEILTNAPESRANFITHIIDEDLASGKHNNVYTRFPPEPNGYLHIGHAKSICLNFGIAQEYQGKCNLRFDDTNPVKEDVEYVDSIKADVEWLGFKWEGEPRYASDYFDALYGYAIELIKKGLAYVDELSPDEMREYRGTLTEPGKNSPYRDRSVEENLALLIWHRLLLLCVTQLFIVLNSLITTKRGINGAFIRCTTSRTVSLMLLNVLLTLYVR